MSNEPKDKPCTWVHWVEVTWFNTMHAQDHEWHLCDGCYRSVVSGQSIRVSPIQGIQCYRLIALHLTRCARYTIRELKSLIIPHNVQNYGSNLPFPFPVSSCPSQPSFYPSFPCLPFHWHCVLCPCHLSVTLDETGHYPAPPPAHIRQWLHTRSYKL